MIHVPKTRQGRFSGGIPSLLAASLSLCAGALSVACADRSLPPPPELAAAQGLMFAEVMREAGAAREATRVYCLFVLDSDSLGDPEAGAVVALAETGATVLAGSECRGATGPTLPLLGDTTALRLQGMKFTPDTVWAAVTVWRGPGAASGYSCWVTNWSAHPEVSCELDWIS